MVAMRAHIVAIDRCRSILDSMAHGALAFRAQVGYSTSLRRGVPAPKKRQKGDSSMVSRPKRL